MTFYQYCMDEKIKVKINGTKIHDFFHPFEFLRYGTGAILNEHLEDQIVDMRIDDFLGLAEPIPKDDEKRHAPQEVFMKDVLAKKKTDWELPILEIKKNEDDVWKVVGHDGRHRANLLKALGFKDMPVHFHILGGGLPISETPKFLYCQNDKHVQRAKERFPFPPITGANYNEPYCSVEGLGTRRGLTEDASINTDSITPRECTEAKRKYESSSKKDVWEAVYRKDFTIPFSTYLQYLQKEWRKHK